MSKNVSEVLGKIVSDVDQVYQKHDELSDRVDSLEQTIKKLLGKQEEKKGQVFDNNSIVAFNVKNPDGSYRRVHIQAENKPHPVIVNNDHKREIVEVKREIEEVDQLPPVKPMLKRQPRVKFDSGIVEKPRVNKDLYVKNSEQSAKEKLEALLVDNE